jgi:hypothetical protein
MARFLSKENYEHVFNISKQYLEESRGLEIVPIEFQKLVAGEMKTIGSIPENKGLALDILNKKAIVAIRESFLNSLQTQVPVTEDKDHDEKCEETFFKKLKDLELQRSVEATAVSATIAPTVIKPAEEPPGAPAPIQMPPSTIIINGAQEARGGAKQDVATISLNSWGRLWQYQNERATFIPSAIVFPHSADINKMSLAKVIVPNIATINWIPYFVFVLEGAGKQSIEVTMVSTYTDKKWIHLEPIAMQTIKPLATPWTITIRDAYGTMLDIGRDGHVISNVLATDRGSLALELSDVSYYGQEFAIGDVLAIGTRRVQVINVHHNSIEIPASLNGDEVKENDQVLNLSRQVSCFLEMPVKK